MSGGQSCWVPVASHSCGHNSLRPLYCHRRQVWPTRICDCNTLSWLVVFFSSCVNGQCVTGVQCGRGVGCTKCTHVCFTCCTRAAKKSKVLHISRAHQLHDIYCLLVLPHQRSLLLTDRSADPDLTAFTADLLDVTMEIVFAGDIPQIVDLLHFSIDVLGNVSSRSSIPSSHLVYYTLVLYSSICLLYS